MKSEYHQRTPDENHEYHRITVCRQQEGCWNKVGTAKQGCNGCVRKLFRIFNKSSIVSGKRMVMICIMPREGDISQD